MQEVSYNLGMLDKNLQEFLKNTLVANAKQLHLKVDVSIDSIYH
jgi:hypothetical protein